MNYWPRIPLLIFLIWFTHLGMSQCVWTEEDFDSFEYLTPSPHLIPGSVYHLSPQTFAGCVNTGFRGLYMNIQNGYIGPLYDRPYDVCPEVEYRFSFWTRDAWAGTNDYDINIYDATGALLLNQNVTTTSTWQFVETAGFTSITPTIRFEIITNTFGGPGNDIGFDDFKLESCIPGPETMNIDICSDGAMMTLHDSISGFMTGVGGTWGGPSGLGGGYLGEFDPAINDAGDYTYTIPGVGLCPDSSVIVTIAEVEVAHPDDVTMDLVTW